MFWAVSPSIEDESLQAGIEVLNPNKPKKTKTGKRKSGSADAGGLSLLFRVIPHAEMGKVEGSVKKSKTGSVDPAEGGMTGQSQPNVSRTLTPVL